LLDLKIDVTLFSETHLKSRIRFYNLNYDIYQSGHEDGHKGGTAIVVMKGIPYTCTNLPPLLSVDARGICISIGNT
jgi:hypothetical protein